MKEGSVGFPSQKKVMIAGASGVFGRLLAEELLTRSSAKLVLAARHKGPLVGLAKQLHAQDRVEVRTLNLENTDSVLQASEDCFAVACTAGPFQKWDPALPGRVAGQGTHWLDIADAQDWVIPILKNKEAHRAAREQGTAIFPGLSMVPALSGVLVRVARKRAKNAQRARVTLFIGNRNPKGAGAISSALTSGIGKPISVNLPVGNYPASIFSSPDQHLLQKELGLECEFRVAFEWGPARWVMERLTPLSTRLGCNSRGTLAHFFQIVAKPFSRFGTQTGCIQAELFTDQLTPQWAAFISRGQRIAILPCFMALQALFEGSLMVRGCVHPATWQSPQRWIHELDDLGVTFCTN